MYWRETHEPEYVIRRLIYREQLEPAQIELIVNGKERFVLPLLGCAALRIQGLNSLHVFLRSKGMAYCYAIFVAGYFLLPMVSGHRRLYYILVLPPALILWRELVSLFRGNQLLYWVLAFICYMISSLAWTADFNLAEALWSIWYSLAVLSFCAVTGYLWIEHPQTMDRFLREKKTKKTTTTCSTA